MITPTAKPKHVPTWLAQRYPQIASLEENPLALYLSGCGYGTRPWYSSGKARAPIPSAPYYALPMIALFSVAFLLGAIFLPVTLVFFRYYMFEKWWRERGQESKLVDWYLSMTPQDIVLGIAGGRLMGRVTGHCIAAGIMSAFIVLWFYCSGLSANGFVLPGIGDCVLAAGVIYSVFAAQLLIAIDSVFTTLDAISVSARRATTPHYTHRFNVRLGDAINGWADGLLRIGMPLLWGGVAGLLFWIVLAVSGIDYGTPPRRINIGLALIVASTAVVGLYLLRLQGRNQIPRSLLRAVYCVQDYLPAILDANPPAL